MNLISNKKRTNLIKVPLYVIKLGLSCLNTFKIRVVLYLFWKGKCEIVDNFSINCRNCKASLLISALKIFKIGY